MPAEKWTADRRRQLTREVLVESARDVFAKRGFHAASLEEIAEAAGFTRGAVYSNFENKEELFFAVLDRHVEVQLAGFDDLFEQAGGPVAAADVDVARAWRRLSGGDDSEWTALTLEFQLYALRNPEVRDRILGRYRDLRARVTAYLEGVLQDLDRTLLVPVEDLAAMVDAAGGGLIHLGLLDPSQAHLLETFIYVLDHGAFGSTTTAPATAPVAEAAHPD